MVVVAVVVGVVAVVVLVVVVMVVVVVVVAVVVKVVVAVVVVLAVAAVVDLCASKVRTHAVLELARCLGPRCLPPLGIRGMPRRRTEQMVLRCQHQNHL